MHKKEAWTKVLASQLFLDCRALSGLYYADFISFYSPTQLCGGGTTKSNSNELPISVPLSFSYMKSYLTCFLRSSCAFLFDSACSFCHFSRALL